MRQVTQVLRTIDDINDWTGKTVCFLLIPLISIMLYEAMVRYVFNSPTIWAFDVSKVTFCIYVILAGGYVLRHRAHVNVDIIYGRFPLRTRAIIDLVTFVFFLAFCGALLWKGFEMAWVSVKLREFGAFTGFRCPVYPYKVALAVGAFLLFLQGLAKFIRDLTTAITGRETA